MLFWRTSNLEPNIISKKHFCPGGMAPSEWTLSIGAVGDIPVAAYSAPGANTMRRNAYCPPIAVSLCLLALSVFYCKRTLWDCGQLWPYVGMGSLGTGLHRDCNAMGGAAKTSPCVRSTCAQNAILSVLIMHIIPNRQIYVAIDNPSLIPSISCLNTSRYLWNHVCAADNATHAENLQSNGYQCVSHLYKFRDGIQVIRSFRYCGARQGWPVLKEISILIKELDFE